MDVREKLVELLDDMQRSGTGYFGSAIENKKIADYLITHGVTVQENVEISDELLKQLKNAPITICKEEPSIEVVQKWISVDERLPELGEHVLVTDGGFVGEFYINRQGQWQRCNVNNYFLLTALDILWWMPLPEPPKGE